MRGENYENREDDLNIEIIKRLQDIRENCGYTQGAFAEKLDVGVEHYRKIESGSYALQTEKHLKLYNVYSIDSTNLIIGVKNQQFNIDVFFANCSKEQRNEFLQKVLTYRSNLMIR